MEIKEINQQELELMCVDVLTQTYADLGQKDNDPQNKVMLAQSLAKDLKRRYAFMPFIAVELAFQNGVRDTELFVVSPATWCKWLNKMKAEIWEGWHNFKQKTYHLIQPHVKQVMLHQPKLILEYNQKLIR